MKIINLGSSMYTNYLVETSTGCLLIDAGNNTTFENFEKKLLKSGHNISDIKFVFITHSHADHLSYLADFVNSSEVIVLAHSIARERIEKGENSPSIFTSKMSLKMSKFSAKFNILKTTWKPVKLESRIIEADKNTDILRKNGFPFDIVCLSGHTLDSIGLLSDDGMMFVGDAIMNSFPSKNCLPLVFEDAEKFKASWKKIVDLKPSNIYLGHGKPVSLKKVIVKQKFAEEIKQMN
ncbi:MAG: MBL fold metallo-hydrolase [Clostridia bacterium]|nr:MBL fold metallo-hydrolase [Clostridia bacterium]